MKCAKFIVKGKVQRVFYRKHTSKAFNKEKIVGFIKNLDNGDVEVVVKLTSDLNINTILNILYEGSPNSEVDEVLMQGCDKSYEFSYMFEVRY